MSRQASSSTARPSSIDRHPDTWKPPIATWNSGSPERPRNVEGARILVRLDTDQRNHAETTVTPQTGDECRHIDAGVRLVDHLDVDVDVRTEDAPLRAIRRNAVDGGERIRRNHRAPPPDHVAIVVVMRRLDQHEEELPHQPTLLPAKRCPANEKTIARLDVAVCDYFTPKGYSRQRLVEGIMAIAHDRSWPDADLRPCPLSRRCRRHGGHRTRSRAPRFS